jgi:D-alanyl-lipoteichoic acid acyltransferase DltB (MBOAT superfamily)
MLFHSYIFIFAFLPVVLLLWHVTNHFGKYKLAQFFVILMSLWFYSYFNYKYIFIILGSILSNYLFSYALEHLGSPKILGFLGISFNLGLLFYFKYYDFFLQNVNQLFQTDIVLKHIVLPLGISFYTFQQISFLADRMMGNAPHYKAIDYVLYVTYFPQLIAGPIVSHDELIPQFWDTARRHFDYSNMITGIRFFVIGLAKKILIADEIGKIADCGFSDIAALDSLSALVVMLSYTLQIYFDFSGYSDMAIGLGSMMNFKLPQNFDSPYRSCSVSEFWRRWHITLNRFFTKYVYFPLGGRAGKIKKIRNTMLVFFLSGIWHGANWTYILWGLLHGIAVSLETLTIYGKFAAKAGKKITRFCTFLFVNLTFVLFRSDSVSLSIKFYHKLFSLRYNGYIWTLVDSMASFKNYMMVLLVKHFVGEQGSMLVYLIWMFLTLAFGFFLTTRPCTKDYVRNKTAGRVEMWLWALVLCLCVISFSGMSTFLYFNF